MAIFVFLHDCNDCKHSDGEKCTINDTLNEVSTDCDKFEWKE